MRVSDERGGGEGGCCTSCEIGVEVSGVVVGVHVWFRRAVSVVVFTVMRVGHRSAELRACVVALVWIDGCGELDVTGLTVFG